MKTLPLSTDPLPAEGRPPVEINLWENNPPGMVAGAGPGEFDETGGMRNVGIPGMVVHFPAGSNTQRPALIACPGGGYGGLAAFSAGNGTLKKFLPRDVVVVVLKYRTRPPCEDVGNDALCDAMRAVRLVRYHAKEWGIDPNKIAVVGWSAGANLTLNLSTHWTSGDAAAADEIERQSCRPDVVAMMCPWPWDRSIGDYPIGAGAPPAFITSAKDDTDAPTSFAQAIADGYDKAGVANKLWLIESGGHMAFSISSTGEGSQWSQHFWDWLQWPAPFNT